MQKVSVIINVRNGQDYLRYALESALSQDYENIEVVVFDNNSTDGTQQICDEFQSSINYFRSNTTLTLYAARNNAVRVSTGDYITFLDSDDLWMSDKIRKQLTVHENYNECISYTGYIICDNSEIETLNGRKIFPYRTTSITNRLFMRNKISIGSVMVPRNIITKHAFNESYNLLGDFELWVRLSIIFPFIGVDEILEISRSHEANLSKLEKSHWLDERIRFLIEIFPLLSMRHYTSAVFYACKTIVKGVIAKSKN